MKSPIEIGRLFLYNQLSPVMTTKLYQERPTQHVIYPFTFAAHASSVPAKTTQGQCIQNEALWDLNNVASRDAKLSSLDPIVDLEMATLDRKVITMADGNWVESTFETIFALPYGIYADEYPRYVVRIRLTHTFN